ncbi:streptophobe family protein [Streptomyces sp. NPDC092296]|uniref:streptophobe family protein n=1 Tax=Streptomyces sp. NPDC092296 TaxID=3366012 RepID=UPI0037F3C8EB
MGKGGWLRWAVQAATAVSWAFVAMAGVAALGLQLLGADDYARLGPLTAAVVALGAGGSVTTTGSVQAFGSGGVAQAATALDVMPLGVAFTGAAVLGVLFVRPLRGRPAVAGRELAVRAGAAVGCALVLLGLLSWVGEDTVTLDIARLAGVGGGQGDGGAGGQGGGLLDGLGGGLGGLLDPGKLPGLIGGAAAPKAAVYYSVRTAPTLLAGLPAVLVVLLLAFAVSRRAPLPHGWEPLGRVVRPVASALWSVLLGAVLVCAAAGVVLPLAHGRSPAVAAGGVLLGTPNAVGLAVPVGLGVPVTGQATGALLDALPSPLDRLLRAGTVQDVTVPRLMELDGSLWLLPVAAALLLLLAGVLTAVRTPVAAPRPAAVREALGAAARLGVALAVLLPAGLALCSVTVGAQLSVFGFSALDAGASLRGGLPPAALYGLLWGAVAGFAGALLVGRLAAAKRPTGVVAPVQGVPVQGGPVQGGPVQGGPVQGVPVQGGPAPYGDLPQHRPPDGGVHPHNPYRAGGAGHPPGGFNPYADGPARTPPPPPHPPHPPHREPGA